jgi:hypothetical protein
LLDLNAHYATFGRSALADEAFSVIFKKKDDFLQ